MDAEDSVKKGIPVESSSGGARLMDDGVNCLPNEIGVPVPASGDGDSEGFGSRKVRTYKRRKCGEVSLEPKITQLEKCSSHQLQDEMAKQVGCTDIGLQKSSCEQVCHPRKSWKSHKTSTDYSLQHWRSSLQNMFQSFSGDHVGISGIECCIRDALSESPQVDTAKFAQGENDTPEDQCIAQHAFVPKRSLIDVGKHADLASTGSVTELHAPTVTQQCQHALFRMIMSERFVSLCKLLSENFQACKFDKILDFSMLNSRMKEGSYEQAPSLFLSDVQQLWKKLHVIGIEMENLTSSICWQLVKEEGYIAIWQKPLNNSCYINRESGAQPPLCDPKDDPDNVWYVNLKPCITRLPENGYGANVSTWPERLHHPPDRLQSIEMDAYISRKELFKAESKYWHEIIQSYVNAYHWKEVNSRNVMDMRAGFGGFAAAMLDLQIDCWVMNVVPVSGFNTLPVIYDRGLIGVMHDWCEPFDTYPRTYDLLHAAGLFSVEKKRCDVSTIMLEMDRILRPDGRVYIRDSITIMTELHEIAVAMGWTCIIQDTGEGPHSSWKILRCDKRM